jgi:hypothetical protein
MRFKIKGARLAALLVPALALAAPAFAQVRPTTLSDSQEAGERDRLSQVRPRDRGAA